MHPELGVGQDDIYTVHGRVNYIVAKAYHRHNLLSFMQKTMQKVASNIRDETVGHVATSATITLYTREVHRNCNAHCDYTNTGSSGKPDVTLENS